MHASIIPAGQQRAGFQVADIFRRHGAACAVANPPSARQQKVLSALMRCRTAALGGHRDVCRHCDDERISYNSCRDRHCPTCQFADQQRWIAARRERILNTHYFHVVFTLPDGLRPIALCNPNTVYDTLFAAASETLLALGRDKLGATLGVTAVLHTWTREMLLHPHVHCIVTGGGLSLDGMDWKPTRPEFLFPIPVMQKLFRGKLLAALDRAYNDGKLVADDWSRLKRSLYRKNWVVFAKRPFGGPEKVFQYLGRYTHRVAISSSRLLDVRDDAITLRTRGADTVTLTPDAFIRRFLLHVLPSGFRKIRHYGLCSPTGVARLFPIAVELLGRIPPPAPVKEDSERSEPEICTVCGVGTIRRIDFAPVLLALPKWRDTS